MISLLAAACAGTSSASDQSSSNIINQQPNTVAQAIVSQGDLTGTPTELCDAVTPASDPSTRSYDAPEEVLDASIDYQAIFCTETGPIYIDLFEDYAPITINNFVFLAERGYYNNTTFHRVIEDFMVQGGDPTASGSGGPGYQFEDEFVGFLNFDVPNLLAMANAGPGTNGSQFFITTVETPHLDYMHTIFGQVIEGQENVANIRLRDPQTDTTPGTSLETVLIITNPEAVVSDYEAPELATQEQVIEAIASIPEIPGITLDVERTGLLESEALVASFPEERSEELATFLDANNYEYSARIAHTNASCDLQNVPLMGMNYTLHTFATKEDAAAALDDDFISTFVTNGAEFESSESEELLYPIYTQTTTACDTDALEARTYWQRGRFIAVASVTIPTNSDGTPDQWLGQVVGRQVYENLLSSILRPEIGH
ncbi:MAG: peptidylprolyl isomerase [Chitinophagaceae bacterium]|nr:peptidylprolyl isomerase [Anaerolineae bacterium]